MGILSGLRVLDLADESGVFCGKLLADMGADVVRVEPPGGDATRDIGPFFEGKAERERSLFFWQYNTNKRGIALDASTADGREALLRLIDVADVVLTTGRPSELVANGLDYATLSARNPELIVTAVTPFGMDGPRAEWKSSDTVAQALGGMLFVNGHPHEAPLRSFGLQAYHSTGVYAAIGVLLALMARRKIGRGQQVDVSLQECVAATVEHVSGFFRQGRGIEVRRGTLHWSRYFRAVKCKDGYALHCTLGDWTSLIEWVNMDGKAQDLLGEEWEDFNHRRKNCNHLFDVLDEWAKEYTVAELVEGAQLRRLPYASVVPVEAVPDNPQLIDRGFFVPIQQPAAGAEITYPGAPYRFTKTPWKLARTAPKVGEHTLEVLRDWTGSPRPKLSTVSAATGTSAPGDSRVLSGIRVLDFTWVVAGPVCTRILADHGAEVIKIERRDSLDFGNRRGGLTGNLNRGKRSVVVNMGNPRGVELMREMVAKCDLVVDNFSARVMRNWGLSYDNLREIRPDIIAMSMSGFGHTGPHKDYVSYGPTLQALTGFTLAMRHPKGEPAGWGFSYSDMVGGYTAALAALLALWHREQTGEGQFVDLSQFEAVAAILGHPLLEVLANRAKPEVTGDRSPERPGAPHGVYRCRDLADGPASDRWIAISVFTDGEWQNLVRVMGNPTWAADPKFENLAGRIVHQEELDAGVESWTRQQVAEEAMEVLQMAGIAAGLVANAKDFCIDDPHLNARGYWAKVPTPEGDVAVVDGLPTRLSATPGRVAAPGPMLGEDTDRVFRDVLGFDADRIAALRSEKVIG